MNCQRRGGISHRTCKQVSLVVGLKLVERSSPFDIFCCSPTSSTQRRGEAQSRGEREIRNELSFQASDKPRSKKTGSKSPESLASRIYRTLDGVPRSGK